MTRKQRIEYLIITLCVLISGFAMGAILRAVMPAGESNNVPSFWVLGLMFGMVYSMIMSSIILAVRFFSKRSLKFKIIAAVLWPISFACVFYTGILMYIPYQIYNIIRIIRSKLNNTEEM